MDTHRSPDTLSTQAQNELVCEELLGWEKCCEESEPGWIEGWFWRMPDGTTTADAPTFTTWAEAGLILEALQARHERSFSLLTSLSTILKGGQLEPEDVRAAALVFIGSSS